MKSSYDLIRPLMEERGISKAALAKIAGVGPSAVTKWARGGSIRISQLRKIADFFRVNVGSLIPYLVSPTLNLGEGDVDPTDWPIGPEMERPQQNDARVERLEVELEKLREEKKTLLEENAKLLGRIEGLEFALRAIGKE